jgi:hypothetical protein
MPADRDTWRSVRTDLESLPEIEWRAIWTSRVPSALLAPIQVPNDWTWDQPQDASLQARANAVFLKAAKARGYENEDQWLDELRYADFVEFEFIGRATDRLPDGTYTKSKSWVLKDAVKHSITLCHQLEAEDVQKPIIGRLPREAIARIEAATVAFMADFEPKLEREMPSLKDRPDRQVREARLLREMIVHYFATAARECMSLFASVDEFEAELRAGIARFVHFGVDQYEWLGPMRKELNAVFFLFAMKGDPWAGIAEADEESKWHVGEIIGGALTRTALELVAEATARADALYKNGATKPKADESVRTAAEADEGDKSGAITPQFPNRAKWLKDRLAERGWTKHDLQRANGPEHRTTQKILDGFDVQLDVLRKVIVGLGSEPYDEKGHPLKVTELDIPNN